MLEGSGVSLPEEARHVWLWGTDDRWNSPGAAGGGQEVFGIVRRVHSRIARSLRDDAQQDAVASVRKVHEHDGLCRLPRPATESASLGGHDHGRDPPAVQARNRQSTDAAGACELSIEQLTEFFPEIRLGETDATIAAEALKEIRTRLGFLLGVGLDYLTLGRTAPTLSGGESQRIRLAGQIGSGLVGVLYILDEPSIGLHPRDNDRLIETLLRLRDSGNTLIVVEHDEDTMRAADHDHRLWPRTRRQRGPDRRGRRPSDEVAKTQSSVTGQFLAGTRSIEPPAKLRPIDRQNAS